MTKLLMTDEQFEKAYLQHSTIYARDKENPSLGVIGSLDAFNPIFVKVAGTLVMRDEYDFITR